MKPKKTKRKPKTLSQRELKSKMKSWLEAWQTKGRAKLMKARYDLGVEISGLIDDYEGQQREIIAALSNCTGDPSAAHNVWAVGKRIKKSVLDQACRLDEDGKSRVTWSHLVEIQVVDSHAEQLQLVKDCREKGWSVSQLRNYIETNWEFTGGIGGPRFSSWTSSLSRAIDRLLELTQPMLKEAVVQEPTDLMKQLDAKMSFREAATRVKHPHIVKTLTALEVVSKQWEEVAESVGAVSEELEAARRILLARQTIYQENQARVRKNGK